MTRSEEVKGFFDKEEKDREDRDAAYQKFENPIQNWIGRGMIKNNIKILLCTVQDILWKDNKWQRISMADMMTPQDVKKIYRKAINMFHPDKMMSEKDPDKLYIANRCFTALNDAFNEFKTRERV